jgi:inner membrane transporter RhtA
VLVVTGIVILQLGAALAGRMFGVVSPAALTGLRLWWAALILAVLGGRGAVATVRAVIADRAWRDAAVVLAFGVTLGIMNYSIYQSFARIPLGVAVTIEFLGPLAVAVASSRRLVDGAWVLLAGAGVALLSEGFGGHRSVAGIAFALAAATSWAVYILLSRATGRRFTGSAGLTIAIAVAAVVVTPAAAAGASAAMLRPSVLSITLAVALLSSVIPYRLELEALRRIPARVFGIWMSLEPAVAALAGLVILSEALSARQWLAIGCVTVASAGAARSEAGKADRARRGAPDAGEEWASDAGRDSCAGPEAGTGPAAGAGPGGPPGRERESAGLPPSPGA